MTGSGIAAPIKTRLFRHSPRKRESSDGKLTLSALGPRLRGVTILLRACTLDRGPDLLRCERHIKMRNTEWHERIEHSVHDRRRRADRTAFSDPLYAQRVRRGGCLLELRTDLRERIRMRNCIIEQRTGQ